MAQVQPFSSVTINLSDILSDDLRLEIETLMVEYEMARVAETEANNAVVLATANLLSARARRAVTRMKLVSAFAKGNNQVAMESNWSPFRNAHGQPAVENFMTERDLRNLQRMQRAQMNTQAADIPGVYDGMFETPDEN